MEINSVNLKKAFCDSVAQTGIGAARSNCDELFLKLVKVVIPESMHQDFPAKILASVTNICSDNPYGWIVDQNEPSITDDTTFNDLYETWFKDIIWEG